MGERGKRMQEHETMVMKAIVAAAGEGKPCPGGAELARLAGFVGRGCVHRLLRRMQDDGLIVVSLRQNGRRRARVITVVETGIATAEPFEADTAALRPVSEFVALAARVAMCEVADLVGRSRARLHSRPRMIACHLARAEGWSCRDVGLAVGRDHATVQYLTTRVAKVRAEDPLFERLFRRTAAALCGNGHETVTVGHMRPVAPRAEPAMEIGDDYELRSRLPSRRVSFDPLLAALRREHPERCRASGLTDATALRASGRK